MRTVAAGALMALVIVLTLCVLLIGIALWQMERRKAAERAGTWLGVIEKIEESDGLRIPRTRGGGVDHIQKGRHVIWVHYRRDDGAQGSFFVGAPGDWRGLDEEPGKPEYDEVRRDWKPDRRLEKPAGEAFPRLA